MQYFFKKVCRTTNKTRHTAPFISLITFPKMADTFQRVLLLSFGLFALIGVLASAVERVPNCPSLKWRSYCSGKCYEVAGRQGSRCPHLVFACLSS